MSFGYSVADLVSTTVLAWKIYKACKDSVSEFRNISSEVVTLHVVLKEVLDSLVCQPLTQHQEAELGSVGKGCNDVLQDLDKLLNRYGSFGTAKGLRMWDRMKWGLEDVKSMRERLISNTTMLSAFNTAFIHFSQARIEDKLNTLITKVGAGKRDSRISTHTLDSLSADDRETWRQLRKSLQDIGISIQAVKQHQRFIVSWLEEAVRVGALEGLDDDDDDDDDDERMENPRISTIGSAADTSLQWPAATPMLPEDCGQLLSSVPNARSRLSSYWPSTPAFHELIGANFKSWPRNAKDVNVEWIKRMLNRGFPVDHHITCQRTMLHMAARYGHESLARLLLERGAQVMATDKQCRTALHLAASTPYCDVVQLLLDHNSEIAANDNQGSTALHIASKNAQEEIVMLLLSKGASIAAKDNRGTTPLHGAASTGAAAVVDLLLLNGADVYEQDNIGRTALHRAASNGQEAAARVLLDWGADGEAKDCDGMTAFQLVPDKSTLRFAYGIPHHLALKMLLKPLESDKLSQYVKLGDSQRVEELLNLGADIDQPSCAGGTALHLAISAGHKNTVKLLLHWGANIDAKDQEGNTALHLAIATGRLDIFDILLGKGANVDAKNANGEKVLHWAVFMKEEDGVGLLLAKGAHINVMDSLNRTPLHIAAWKTHPRITRRLLNGIVDIAAIDIYGKTALHLAASSKGWTALHYAVMMGDEAVAQVLLDRGAAIGAKTADGVTALELISTAGKPGMKALLESAARSAP